jgi:hypothetical protein
MSDVPSNDDDLLIRELGEAVGQAAAVPPEHAEAARAAWSWRTVDAELELLHLSVDSATSLAPVVRGGAGDGSRALSFVGNGVALHLEVLDEELSGLMVPARPGPLVVESARGPLRTVEVDEQGFFALAERPAGPTRFRQPAGLVTEWVTL